MLVWAKQFRRISIAQKAVACQHRDCDSDSVSFTNAIIDSLRRQSLLRLPSKLKINFVCSTTDVRFLTVDVSSALQALNRTEDRMRVS